VLHQHALRRQANDSVSAALDLSVQEGVISGQDAEDELWGMAARLVGSMVGALDGGGNIAASLDDGRLHGFEDDTGVSAGAAELIEKILDLLRGALSKNQDSPGVDGGANLDALVLQVPGALRRDNLRLARVLSIQNSRRLQDAALDLEEIGGDGDLEFVQKFSAGLDEAVTGTAASHALLGLAIGNLDHFRGLHGIKLAQVTLSNGDTDDFHGKEDGLLGGADLDAGKLRVLQSDVVFLAEVVSDTLLRAILTAKHKLRGGSGSEAEGLVLALGLATMRSLDTGHSQEALKGLTGASFNDEGLLLRETEEITTQGDQGTTSDEGGSRGVDVQQETAERGTQRQEKALPDINGTSDGNGTVPRAMVNGAANNHVVLRHRVAHDDLEGGDDIIRGVGKLAIDKVLEDGQVDGAHLSDLENKVTHLTRTTPGNRNLDAEALLGEGTKGVNVGHAVVGSGAAAKLALTIVGLQFVEQVTTKIAGDLRAHLHVVLNNLTNGETSNLSKGKISFHVL